MSRRYQIAIILFFIVLIGGVFRFWALGSSELTFDEGLDAFRSIRYLDYLASDAQSTPVQWFTNASLPWWTHLSFHDHPPLFFLVQHIFFRLGGDSLFFARLPSALAGVASIILFYLIARTLFSPFDQDSRRSGFFGFPPSVCAGFAAALLASVSMALVLVSRLSMQEGLLFFLLLLNFYFFLRFVEEPRKWWLAFGATLGLALLTKYTAVVLLPVYGIYLLIIQRSLFRDRRLYQVVLVSAVLFSPVLVYNIALWRAFGHFDLQFFYLFHQHTAHWQPLTWGKTQEPFFYLWNNLRVIFSPAFLIISAAAILFFAATAFRKTQSGRSRDSTLWVLSISSFFFITLFLVFAGSAIRFSALYAIPAVFLIAAATLALRERFSKKNVVLILFFVLVISEGWFTARTLFADPPDYGVVKLDRYLDLVFDNARSDAVPTDANSHLEAVIQANAQKFPALGSRMGVVYDDNLAISPSLWLFSRRKYYHALPMVKLSDLEKALESRDLTPFKNMEWRLVIAGPDVPLQNHPIPYSDKLAAFLEALARQNPPLAIRDGSGQTSFFVYRFSVR